MSIKSVFLLKINTDVSNQPEFLATSVTPLISSNRFFDHIVKEIRPSISMISEKKPVLSNQNKNLLLVSKLTTHHPLIFHIQ